MGVLDFILNLAGLLLWLSWRTAGFDPLRKATPSTLVGTLKRAGRTSLKRWHLLAMIGALLFLRGCFYLMLGSMFNWAVSLNIGSISIAFRCDSFWRMQLFSVLSFGVALGIYYSWLLFLSLLRGDGSETDPIQKLARLHLGRPDRWPQWMKLLAPLLVGGALWWLLSWPLARWDIVPRPVSAAHRIEQALLTGLGCYLAWEYLIVALLALHMVGSYVFFGTHPFWNFTNNVSRRLLKPLRLIPLRAGKVDFAPLIGIVLVLLLGRLLEIGLANLYTRLPL